MAEQDPIEKLHALLSKATPGEWEVTLANASLYTRRGDWIADCDSERDARAIAALRNLAPRLLAVVEAAERLRPVVSDAGLLDAPATFVDDDAAADLVSRLRALRAKAAEVLR